MTTETKISNKDKTNFEFPDQPIKCLRPKKNYLKYEQNLNDEEGKYYS